MSRGHAHGHGASHPRDPHHEHAHADEPGHGHGHGHAHGHAEHALSASSRRLAIALGLTLMFFGVEVAAGLYTHSLALLSDAGHMLTDSGALLLALVAQRIAARPRTRVHTFGFRRAEILAALVNAALLIATTVGIVVEGISRLSAPPHIQAGPMLWVACGGLAINIVAALVLGTGGHDNTNMRAAFAHVLSDALGSVASIVAALSVMYFDFALADPLASLAISLLIGISALRLLRQTSNVLMETAPAHVDLHELEGVIRATPGVSDLHDLHAWTISDGFSIVTVHVVLDGSGHGTDVARVVGERIRQQFGIQHVTVQPEAPSSSTQLLPVERLTRTSESALGPCTHVLGPKRVSD
jgi:cobalt-zinc-cadmium efflux system protein